MKHKSTKRKPIIAELTPGKNAAWVTIDTIAVYVQRTDEGVVVDLYPANKTDAPSIASCYAFFSEGEEQ